MDSVQAVILVLAFVTFVVLSVVAHKVFAPTPVPVPVKVAPELSLEDMQNRMFL